MADSPPPVDFDEDVEVPESDEEPEASPFADPGTSAMDEIEPELPELPATTEIDLDNEDDIPQSKPVEPAVVETAPPPPTIEARAADEPEPVQPAPIVKDNQGLFDEGPPTSKPAEQVRVISSTPPHYTHSLFTRHPHYTH